MIRIILVLFVFVNITLAQVSVSTILSPEMITIKNPSDESLKEIETIHNNMEIYNLDFQSKIEKYYKINGNSIGFEFDNKKQFKFIENYILSNADEIVKQYAAMQIPKIMLNGYHENIDTNTKKEILKMFKFNDIMWSLDTQAILFFSNWNTNIAIEEYVYSLKGLYLFVTGDIQEKSKEMMMSKSKEFYLGLYKENPDRGVKAVALANYIGFLHLHNNIDEANKYFTILENSFSDVKEIEFTLNRFAPYKPTTIGNHVPFFSGKDTRSSLELTPDIFNGKYYLIQFWSITCPPCVAEMKEIHKIHEKYKNKNFEILSFSIGDSQVNLDKFWKSKWTMPWYNVSLTNNWNDDISKSFSVTAIPNLLLISPDGIIVENEDTFGDKNIEEVISKHFNN
ncbi:MAG: TlpA family protein disulfide reductase [Bacteroidetes bacterium]|nr:TlpA family protein disulfide reductase [Bacteroidota bacterium]MBU1113510.1 TlpA family protein disulfide reductase [Bacteroidota bacterium]MBU1797040.1 TlpA family protein disulfide reductase [Bacteroidota bacterium]